MNLFRVAKHAYAIQNYKDEALINSYNFLKSLNISHIEFGLERIKKICSIMGNPQNKYKSVLIGGTNGKGSVCAFLASILQEANLKVGLFTSPHLISPEERIQINREPIHKFKLAKLITEHRKIDSEYNIGLTYFEFLTSIAFRYFKEENVDVGVFEVGLGGRYDATNILEPLISCVTHIDYDHVDILGDTLIKIAKEKAGIIKPNGCFIHSEKRPFIKKLFKQICQTHNSIYIDALRNCKFEIRFRNPYCKLFLTTPYCKYESILIPLIGPHQVFNAILAIRIAEELNNKFCFKIDQNTIAKGIRKAKWEGRLEIVKQNPLIILDCAHNPDGIKASLNAIKFMRKKKRVIIIFGVLRDKLWHEMLNAVNNEADYLILTKPDSDRALLPEEFLICAIKKPFHIERDPEVALSEAIKKAKSEDMILVIGSTYLVGQIKKSLIGK
jgi:dihydrofolate synthase/folylpolyglutamate synthase